MDVLHRRHAESRPQWRRRCCTAIAVATIGLTAPGGLVAAADPASAPTPPTTPDTSPTETEGTSATTATGIGNNEFLPEDRDIGDCLGALERPGCGSEARGGWRQTAIFAVLVAVLAFGAWRIIVMIRRRDKAMMSDQRSARSAGSAGPGDPPPEGDPDAR